MKLTGYKILGVTWWLTFYVVLYTATKNILSWRDMFGKKRNSPFKRYACWLISDLNIYRVKSTSHFTIKNFDKLIFPLKAFCRKQPKKREQASNGTLKGRIPMPTIHVLNPLWHQCPLNCRQRNSIKYHYNKQILKENNNIEHIMT